MGEAGQDPDSASYSSALLRSPCTRSRTRRSPSGSAGAGLSSGSPASSGRAGKLSLQQALAPSNDATDAADAARGEETAETPPPAEGRPSGGAAPCPQALPPHLAHPAPDLSVSHASPPPAAPANPPTAAHNPAPAAEDAPQRSPPPAIPVLPLPAVYEAALAAAELLTAYVESDLGVQDFLADLRLDREVAATALRTLIYCFPQNLERDNGVIQAAVRADVIAKVGAKIHDLSFITPQRKYVQAPRNHLAVNVIFPSQAEAEAALQTYQNPTRVRVRALGRSYVVWVQHLSSFLAGLEEALKLGQVALAVRGFPIGCDISLLIRRVTSEWKDKDGVIHPPHFTDCELVPWVHPRLGHSNGTYKGWCVPHPDNPLATSLPTMQFFMANQARPTQLLLSNRSCTLCGGPHFVHEHPWLPQLGATRSPSMLTSQCKQSTTPTVCVSVPSRLPPFLLFPSSGHSCFNQARSGRPPQASISAISIFCCALKLSRRRPFAPPCLANASLSPLDTPGPLSSLPRLL